jgi:xanthine dehydrogenase YagR molybdenum-binding subunit
MASAVYPSHRSPASVRAVMKSDGTVIVSSGSHEMGMGTATVMAQLAAETLGVPFERVRFEYGDTTLPQAPISAGSMTVSSVGSAVFGACNALKQKLAELGGSPSDPSVLAKHYLPSVEVQFDAKPDEQEQTHSSQAFGAQFAEVSVDPDLGIIRVPRIVSAFGGGRILNAKTARSQFRGGIVMGRGRALTEETLFDERSGRIVNATMAEYHVPVHLDVPEIDVIWTDIPDPHAPMGARGIGEIGITGTAAAVANAIFNATGKRIRDLPITLDKLL